MLLDSWKRLKSFGRSRGELWRLASCEDGGTAVEFSLVAVPFLGLLFAILETGLVFFAGQVLETAAADSARLIRTGQAQTQGFDQARFRQEVCNRTYGLVQCSGPLYVDVQKFGSFTSINLPNPIDQNGNLVNNFVYQPGTAGDIVVVRVLYEWPIFVAKLGYNLANMSGSKRLLVATAAFRNEPYQ